jgi:NADPH2:quinone reductase
LRQPARSKNDPRSRLPALTSFLVTDTEQLPGRVLDATAGTGVDIVLDHVGGDALDAAIASAVKGGDVVSVGRLGGGTATIDLFALARRHVRVRSVSYGLTPPEVIGDRMAALNAQILPAIAAGRITAVVDSIHSFADATEARDRLATGEGVGKVVLTVSTHGD